MLKNTLSSVSNVCAFRAKLKNCVLTSKTCLQFMPAVKALPVNTFKEHVLWTLKKAAKIISKLHRRSELLG